MSDLGQVAGAIQSVTDLVAGILDRADRDGPEKELNEDINKIQNSFSNNSLDDEWVCAFKLFNSAGHPLTSGGIVGETDRQYRFNSLIIAAELKYAKQIISRLVAQKVK